ncbi:MAG TPA: dihydroorotate dehydrogenase [Casimicrobiaceae bacterium]|nr:dihydroorotate dehydrogenase [Casimicrobiaceae bacterium]
MVDLSVRIGAVTLANPVMPGSGTFSTEFGQVIDLNRLGAMVTKTVSRPYRPGNPPPRVHEVEAGMINSIGLPTKGLAYFLEHQLPEYRRYTAPTVCSITSETMDDFAQMAQDVSVEGVTAIELNISCPTRRPGGGNFALNEDTTYKVVKACRAMTDKPLWAKLSPNAGEITAVAEAAERAGANAITVSNTILGLKINVDTFRSCIGNGYGGISGPGVKPIVLRMVHQCSKAVKIPIIGCGGIMKTEDVVEYLLAGATAVQVGFANFRNPTAMIGLIEGLAKWCERKGIVRVADLTGAMRDHPPRDTYEAGMIGIS